MKKQDWKTQVEQLSEEIKRINILVKQSNKTVDFKEDRL